MFALKREREWGRRMNDIVVCYMGDGAASEGDFHAGLGMASTAGGPGVFFIRVSEI
jgi:2-oxoisovalerate dehydrogenase E1 component alpha subunit